MSPPPRWNLWGRYRAWARENPAQAQIAAITAGAIGLIVFMFVATIVIIIGLLR